MKNTLLTCFALFCALSCLSQTATIQFLDIQSEKGMPDVKVYNHNQRILTVSNENGTVSISGNPNDSISIRSFGYQSERVVFKSIMDRKTYSLRPSAQLVQEVTVVAQERKNLGVQSLDALTLKLLPINNAQDLLRTVSGLFIAQHAGGGKAEQIFLRGFDNDHGTDFAIFYDGIPINISNHAHGQGYSDMHFIIPETVQGADYYKGPHELRNGNFAVSGAARFKTKSRIDQNLLKLDVGDFGTQRGVVMLNFTPNNKLFTKKNYESSYLAVEGNLNQSFFESPQDFKKLSTLYRYNIQLKKTTVSSGVSYFNSSWNASGQIPLRAVTNGSIDWYGAIDDTEGGQTSRGNVFVKAKTRLSGGHSIENFIFYSKNDYTLYSNFTFFLNDSINGDMIDQREDRHIVGYRGAYRRFDKIKNMRLKSEIGYGIKYDIAKTGLYKSNQRATLDVLDRHKVWETNADVYIRESIDLNSRWTIIAGTRVDFLNGRVDDVLDTTSNTITAHRFSPKFSVFYNPTETWQLFAKASSGFHSNYIKAATDNLTTSPLPGALSADLGTEFKLGRKLVSSIVLWTIQSDAEYIFVADASEFENKGSSIRYGADLAFKFQPIEELIFDWSGNMSYGELLEESEGENSIPSAPRFTSTLAVIFSPIKPLSIYVGGRYMARRPLIEDESIWADDYLILDANVTYSFKNNIQLGISIQNFLNEQWMEAVFYDSSKLANETEAVDDFHFTPGTPRFVKASISYLF